MELLREADSVLKEEPDVESKKSHDLREFFLFKYILQSWTFYATLCFVLTLIVRVTLSTLHLYNWS